MTPRSPAVSFRPAILLALLGSLLLSGCITARVEETKDAATGMDSGDNVVILARSHITGNETEINFVDCVTEKVASGSNRVSVYPAAEFVDALFPWFEPRTSPKNIEDLPDLLARPGILERIQERNIRYIIWVRGDTDQTNSGGGLSCAVGPGGGGCFGLAWWEDQAAYKAAVWDLDDGVQSGSVSANVTGTSAIPAVVVPVPLIARTRAAACKGLSKQLKTFLNE